MYGYWSRSPETLIPGRFTYYRLTLYTKEKDPAKIAGPQN